MNPVIYAMFGFVLTGLFSHRLGRWTYIVVGCLVAALVFYAYRKA